jgi:formylglycine-generating enzyme required for sulfatase activity
VTAAQRPGSKLVDIAYDVTSDETNIVTVSVVVSNAAGLVSASHFSGHVGAGVPTGTGRQIVWDGGADQDGQNLSALRVWVDATVGSGGPTGDYLVVDVAAGSTATNYPVCYLSAMPAGGWADEYKTTKMVFRRIPAGTFMMGSPTNELGRDSDETQHQVTLTQPFYIGVFEVTQRQWERVMGTWPSSFTNTSCRDSRPVEWVSYNMIRGSSAGANWPANNNVDATSFMGRLRSRAGRAFDLPTESQWEYAGRAGATTALNSGSNDFEVGRFWGNGGSNYAQSVDTSGGTAKVGSYLPNAWGLFDFHGNVSEKCIDWYGGCPDPVIDPPGPETGSDRVLRGLGWTTSGDRIAYRHYRSAENIQGFDGFRAAVLFSSYMTLPSEVSVLAATPGDGQISLSWQNPSDADFAGVRIQRKTGGYPVDSNDGTTVYSNDGTNAVDAGLTNGTAYYYKAFSYNTVSNYSGGVTVTATPQAVPSGMVLIPAGTNNGTNPFDENNPYRDIFYPQTYSLTVSSFYMDECEVTKELWDAVFNWAVTNGYTFDNIGTGKTNNHPVQTVNWYDCVKWCNARSEKESRPPAYYMDSAKTTIYRTGQTNLEDNCVNWTDGYRLPTDTEWEYAARGSVSSKRYPWGSDTIDHDKANYYGDPFHYSYDLGYSGWDTRYYSGGYPFMCTSPVGSFEAGRNAYGLYDMAGNVREWCWNWIFGSSRVSRGGDWNAPPWMSGVACPYGGSVGPGYAHDDLGFRAVLPTGQ